MGNSVKKIGLFGGTFNPVHFGHLNLAIELKEKKELDEIWMIPARAAPLREEAEVSPEDRLKMVNLAVSEIPGFRVLDWELRRDPPSYTIDTVKQILETFPNDHFFLILGEDTLLHFADWKDPHEIIRLVPLLVGLRLKNPLPPSASPEIQQAIRKGMVETSIIEISATQIRDRLNKRLYCGHLAPSKVLDFIYENQLYFTLHR